MEKFLRITGRVLLALIFIVSGLGKLFHFHDSAGMMASKGMPAASLLLAVAIAFEILGGLSVLTGFKARWGALALVAFLIPTTLIFHNFWAFQGMVQQDQMAHFMKNLGLMGGLLLLASYSKD